jgi:anionic cell wall polymer biosynthesis LytR-Cps2A-Psr (LCP) family protein
MGKVIKRWLSLLTAVALCLSACGTAALAEDTSPAAEAARLAAQTDNPLINKYATVITDDENISLSSDVINVLLLGIDNQDKNYTYRTEMAHTDAMLLLSINLAADRSGPMFNLISIPRDTMAYVPAVKGIYKINSAINCGDALGVGVSRADDDAVVGESQAGFKAVCDTVSWLLGGIGIDYYCAVTMDAMEELGDVIGGIDFDVEMSFTGHSKPTTRQVINTWTALVLLTTSAPGETRPSPPAATRRARGGSGTLWKRSWTNSCG